MYRVIGFLKNVPPDRLVNELLKTYPQLKHRARIFGYDIELYRDNLELFIQTYDELEYNIDLAYKGSEEDMLSFLTTLKNILVIFEKPLELSWFEEDEDGNQLSPEHNFFDNNIGNDV